MSLLGVGLMRFQVKIALILGFLSIGLSSPMVGLAATIGEVALAKGVVTAQSAERGLVSLAKGSPIFEGDMLETSERSFLVVKFSDGGKITLRPESQFNIDEYNASPGQEKESFRLIKGGLRAVTGAIGKNRPENVSYKAKNTTIGIRGTTFVMKICEPGTDGCRTAPDTEVSEEDQNQLVDIFVINKNGGSKQKITRKRLQQILDGVYVEVIEGGVRVDAGDKYIDMGAGDKCVVGSGSGVECFSLGIDLPGQDVYLTEEVENVSGFNLLERVELKVGGELCEID